MLQAANRIKAYDPTIYIALGGPHVTLTKGLLISDENVDFIIQGEGEEPFAELISRLDAKKPLDDISGLIYKDNGKIKINHPKNVEDLDSLPLPAFEISKLDVYYELFMKSFDKLAILLYPRSYRIPLESSRGCPVSCNFCCAKTIVGNRWRGKSPERMIQEISRLEELFPKIFHADDTYITYVDNNFTTSKKRVREFCELKNKSVYDKKWAALSRATDLNYDLLKTMVKAGFIATYIGGESGNLESLITMGKKYKEDSTLAAVQACIETNVERIIVSFIVGLPSEDLPAIKKTLSYAYKIRELAPDQVIISVYKATPYPSTSFWDEMDAQGRLSPDLEKYDLALPKGLVFNHPIFGFEAYEIDEIINLWNKLTGVKYLTKKYLEKELPPEFLIKYLSRILKELQSQGYTQFPSPSTLTGVKGPQILDLLDHSVKELENLVLI